MSEEEQAKKTSQVVTDAAVKEVIPAKPIGELSDTELAGVAGGNKYADDFKQLSDHLDPPSPKCAYQPSKI